MNDCSEEYVVNYTPCTRTPLRTGRLGVAWGCHILHVVFLAHSISLFFGQKNRVEPHTQREWLTAREWNLLRYFGRTTHVVAPLEETSNPTPCASTPLLADWGRALAVTRHMLLAHSISLWGCQGLSHVQKGSLCKGGDNKYDTDPPHYTRSSWALSHP